jgi:hypothetical protein
MKIGPKSPTTRTGRKSRPSSMLRKARSHVIKSTRWQKKLIQIWLRSRHTRMDLRRLCKLAKSPTTPILALSINLIKILTFRRSIGTISQRMKTFLSKLRSRDFIKDLSGERQWPSKIRRTRGGMSFLSILMIKAWGLSRLITWEMTGWDLDTRANFCKV